MVITQYLAGSIVTVCCEVVALEGRVNVVTAFPILAFTVAVGVYAACLRSELPSFCGVAV